MLRSQVAKSRSPVLNNVDAILAPHGFARQKTSWTRSTGHYTDVIDVQYSVFEPLFTLNIGVFDPRLHALIWKKPTLPLIAASGVVCCRISDFLGGPDRWYSTRECKAEDWLEIESTLNDKVIPFLAKNHSPEGLTETLETQGAVKNTAFPGVIYWAVLMTEIGKGEQGRVILNEKFERYGYPLRRTIAEALRLSQAS